MARVPVLQKKPQPNRAQIVIAKVGAAWLAAKVSVKGLRTAKKSADAYGTAKDTGRTVAKYAAVPVAVAGGVVVWRKVRSDSSSDNGASADAGRPLGPVASAETVSPPADAAAQAAGSEAQAS